MTGDDDLKSTNKWLHDFAFPVDHAEVDRVSGILLDALANSDGTHSDLHMKMCLMIKVQAMLLAGLIKQCEAWDFVEAYSEKVAAGVEAETYRYLDAFGLDVRRFQRKRRASGS